MAAERALSSFDHRHRLVGNFTYLLPQRGGSRWLSRLAADWQLGGIATLQSGAPFTAVLGTDRANIGSGPAQRPDATCDPNAGGAQTAAQWFNTSCFSLPAPFMLGNSGRNTIFAPGYADIDVSVQQVALVANGVRLQLRWEVFNLLNRANFGVPNRTAFAQNFGRIFSAGPARQMQFGVKVVF
jgi:hypothetical protein